MAKKLGKFLAATAIIGTAVAGGLALYNKYKTHEDDLDDDFMDFDDDFDDDLDDDDSEEANRSYVNITYDKTNDDASEATATETDTADEVKPDTEEK